jgi:sugar lactone lactonase YvrE
VTPTTGVFPIGVTDGAAPSTPVALANPTGIAAGDADGTQLPYFLCPGTLAAGATSQPMLWIFSIPAGVTAFTFSVTVVAATPGPIPLDSATNIGSGQVYVSTLAGIPFSPGHRDGPVAGATFYSSGFTATDSVGDIFVADSGNNEIRRISANGMVTTVAGNPTFGSADGTGDVASFSSPAGIAVTPDGQTIFVADWSNYRIRRISLTGFDPTIAANWTVNTIIGNGTAGGNYTADTPGDLATVNGPYGLAYNVSDHTLYFTEFDGNRVRMATLRGSDPTVAHNWVVSLIAGDASEVTGAPGLKNGAGITALFDWPTGLAFDAAGNLYVCEQKNNTIRKITPGNTVSTLAGSTTLGYQDGQGSAARFSQPNGIAVDNEGDVYVADSGNAVIRKITSLGQVTTVAGNGGEGHIDGPGSVARLYLPSGLSIQADGTLIVGGCDSGADLRAISRSFSESTVGP